MVVISFCVWLWHWSAGFIRLLFLNFTFWCLVMTLTLVYDFAVLGDTIPMFYLDIVGCPSSSVHVFESHHCHQKCRVVWDQVFYGKQGIQKDNFQPWQSLFRANILFLLVTDSRQIWNLHHIVTYSLDKIAWTYRHNTNVDMTKHKHLVH